MVLQFSDQDNGTFGILLDTEGQILAELPGLCDVAGKKLLFDYSGGEIRESSIYSVEELIKMAESP